MKTETVTLGRTAVTILGCVLAAGLVSACAPAIHETRMVYAEPRAADCKIEFVQVPMEEMTPFGRFHTLGYLSIAARGELDPFSPENKKLIHERACRMGADIVTVSMAASGPAGFGTASRVLYAVLKRKARPRHGDTTAPRKTGGLCNGSGQDESN